MESLGLLQLESRVRERCRIVGNNKFSAFAKTTKNQSDRDTVLEQRHHDVHRKAKNRMARSHHIANGIELAGDRHALLIPSPTWTALRPLLPRSILLPDLSGLKDASDPQNDIHSFVEERRDPVVLNTRAYAHVSRLLTRAGFPELPPFRVQTPALALPSVDDDATTEELLLIEALLAHHFGQIVVRRAEDVVTMLARIARAFPDGRFLIPVGTVAVADQLARDLAHALAEPVAVLRGLNPGVGTRVAVATYHAARQANERNYGAFLIPLTAGGLTDWMRKLTRYQEADRCYLISTSQIRVPRAEKDEWLFRPGPVVYDQARLTSPESVYSSVAFGGSSGAKLPARRGNANRPLLDKRKLYWCHDVRNQLIAAIARELVADPSATPRDGRASVAVLVETQEHAGRLQKLLQGSTLVGKGAIPAAIPTNLILTTSAAAQWSDLRADCVIVGCGGLPSNWVASWLARQSAEGSAVQLIDLTDEFDAEAARLARARLDSYRAAGAHWRPLPNNTLKRAWRSLRTTRPRRAQQTVQSGDPRS
ncbi:MAG TPA: hypothetical protein VM165_06040 [Planctomycetaceae bacterium]|nr:hypothetical protein [Planctomycetaceae bacterium]